MNGNRNRGRAGIARRILGDILILLALAVTVSVCVTMGHRIGAVVQGDEYRKVFRYQLILCVALLLFALDLRFGFWTRLRPRALKLIGWIPRCLIAALAAVILFYGGRVIAGGLIRTAGESDHVLVLGLALENGKPADDLIRRLETARGYLEEHPGATLILTGGNPDESGRTEAAVMRDILLERGVSEERMVLEDQAKDTRQNFRNAAQLTYPEKPVVLVTSDYHMDRAVRIAGKAGFPNCLRLPAPSDPAAFGANMMSEVVLNLDELSRSLLGGKR
ncbi:MAG: YdcF family protein [Clostridia bacterium]|nr:YdcF family protein [Clostridia bacterium]